MQPRGPAIFGMAAAFLAVVVLLACAIPARRAGLAAIAQWEEQHGRFSAEEMEEARRSVRASSERREEPGGGDDLAALGEAGDLCDSHKLRTALPLSVFC